MGHSDLIVWEVQGDVKNNFWVSGLSTSNFIVFSHWFKELPILYILIIVCIWVNIFNFYFSWYHFIWISTSLYLYFFRKKHVFFMFILLHDVRIILLSLSTPPVHIHFLLLQCLPKLMIRMPAINTII